MNVDFKVWEGIYRTFSEAPSVGLGFEGKTWLNRSLHGARRELKRLRAGQTLSHAVRQRNAVLPAVLAAMLADRDNVRVVDVGGGLGLGYMAVAAAVSDFERIDYNVVEVESINRAGRDLFGASGPVFHDEFPMGQLFDVAYASSTLQYIERWQDVIVAMISVRPSYLLLSDIFVGSFESYVTLQNYYESRIPCWFLNFNELRAEVQRHGYRLCLKLNAISEILGQDKFIPMNNFPEDLRVENAFHIMFAR